VGSNSRYYDGLGDRFGGGITLDGNDFESGTLLNPEYAISSVSEDSHSVVTLTMAAPSPFSSTPTGLVLEGLIGATWLNAENFNGIDGQGCLLILVSGSTIYCNDRSNHGAYSGGSETGYVELWAFQASVVLGEDSNDGNTTFTHNYQEYTPGTMPVNTISTSAITAVSLQTITPTSMTNILPGTILSIDGGPNNEQVMVKSIAGATFSAFFSTAHLAGTTISTPLIGTMIYNQQVSNYEGNRIYGFGFSYPGSTCLMYEQQGPAGPGGANVLTNSGNVIERCDNGIAMPPNIAIGVGSGTVQIGANDYFSVGPNSETNYPVSGTVHPVESVSAITATNVTCSETAANIVTLTINGTSSQYNYGVPMNFWLTGLTYCTWINNKHLNSINVNVGSTTNTITFLDTTHHGAALSSAETGTATTSSPPQGGGFVDDAMTYYFSNKAVVFSAENANTDVSLDPTRSNTFYLQGTATTYTGFYGTPQAGWTFWVISPNASTITLANSAFHLCSGVDFTLPANVPFEFTVNTDNVVREVGCSSVLYRAKGVVFSGTSGPTVLADTGSTSAYLRADGTWQSPAGSGAGLGANIFAGAQTAPGFWPQSGSAGPFFSYFDDFLGASGIQAGSIGSSVGSACLSNNAYEDVGHPGNIFLSSGTGGSGTGEFCAVGSSGVTQIASPNSSPAWTWESAVYVPVLPGTTAGSYQIGLGGALTNPWTTGIGFYLSSDNGVANDWYCEYGTTYTDTTHAATPAWTRFTIVNDGANVHWYIAGAEVCGTGVALASIPSGAQWLAWTATAKSATNVHIAADYVLFQRAVVR
jgi:hypothetical protein